MVNASNKARATEVSKCLAFPLLVLLFRPCWVKAQDALTSFTRLLNIRVSATSSLLGSNYRVAYSDRVSGICITNNLGIDAS